MSVPEAFIARRPDATPNSSTGRPYGWLDIRATFIGPLWAAGRRRWLPFWMVVLLDVVGLTLVARALWRDGGLSMSQPLMLSVGIATFAAGRILLGAAAARQARPGGLGTTDESGPDLKSQIVAGALLLPGYLLTAWRFSASGIPEFLEKFPTRREIARSTMQAINRATEWLIVNFSDFFDGITAFLRMILEFLELMFVGTPWPVVMVALVVLAWQVSNTRTAVFTAICLAYMGLFGLWELAMSTVSLVAAATFICVAVGLPLGIWCGKSPRVYRVMKPALDLMQTMPTFVYLIPAVAFFSIGKPPAILATFIFALPPIVRLTALGIEQVPAGVKEAAVAFGASPRQMLFKVELPLAAPSIMQGVNQTIMMSLSMVVIAALIGAGGLGYEVLFSLQNVDAGRGVIAGLGIVLCAMVLDRMVQGRSS